MTGNVISPSDWLCRHRFGKDAVHYAANPIYTALSGLTRIFPLAIPQGGTIRLIERALQHVSLQSDSESHRQ